MSAPQPLFTLAQFQKICKAKPEHAKIHYEPVLNALTNYAITDKAVIASFLATIAPESQNLSKVKEDLYYKDPERLAKIFLSKFDLDGDRKISPAEVEYAAQFTKNPEALNQKLYNGFCGRAIGQITWEGNYRTVGTQLGQDFVKNPTLLEDPVWSALASLAFFIHVGMPAVAGDADRSRRIWNGPAKLGVPEYKEYFKLAMDTLP